MTQDDILLSVGIDLEAAKVELNKLERLVEQVGKANSEHNLGLSKKALTTYSKAVLKELNTAAKTANKLNLDVAKREYANRTKVLKAYKTANGKALREQEKLKEHLRAKELATLKANIRSRSKQQEKELKRVSTLSQKQAERDYAYRIKFIKAEQKEKERIYAHSAAGAWDNKTGTTLGHKAVTTSQYMAIGAAIVGVTNSLKQLTEMSIEYDNALYKNIAVLKISTNQSKLLLEANFDIAESYGLLTEEVNQAAITLGRAGISYNNIIEATRVTSMLAKITGDSLNDSSKVVSSFTMAFGLASNQVHELGSELAYAANASKMSIDDLGTMANYALSGANALGMTKEAVLAFSTAFSNIGVNASTIGTQMRKFGKLMREETEASQKFFTVTGMNQKELLKQFKKGGDESDKAFIKFTKNIASLTDDGYERAVSGMNILMKQMLDSVRLTSDNIEEHIEKLKNGGDDLEAQARINALSIEGLWNSAKASIARAASGIATSIVDIFSSRDELMLLTDSLKYLTVNSEAYNKIIAERKDILDETKRIQDNSALPDTKAETQALKEQLEVEKAKLKVKLENILLIKDYKTNSVLVDKVKALLKKLDAVDGKITDVTKKIKNFNNGELANIDGNALVDDKLLAKIDKLQHRLDILKADKPENRLKIINKELAELISKPIDGEARVKILTLEIEKQTQLNKIKHKAYADAKKALNEQIRLQAQLRKATYGESDYDKLISKYNDYVAKANGNTKTLILINEWYSSELTKLNNKEIKAYQDKEDKKAEISRKAYSEYIKLLGVEEEAFYQKTSDILQRLAATGALTDKQLQNIFTSLKLDFDTDILFSELDATEDKYTSLLDAQIALAESGKDWGTNVTKSAKAISNAIKPLTNLTVIDLKYKKEQKKLNTTYAKETIKNQNIIEKKNLEGLDTSKEMLKQDELNNEFTIAASKINQEKFAAEINGYSELAGAMGSMFEQGTTGAKAFSLIQATLGVISAYTAITNATAITPALGAAVASSMLPIIGTLMSLGGGSSGSESYDVPSVADTKSDEVNSYYDTILGKFDRQINLLEAIEKNGTASKLETESFSYDFNKELELAGLSVRKSIEDKMEKISDDSGVDVIGAYNTAYQDHAIIDPVEFFSQAEAPNLFDDFFDNDDVNKWWEDVYGLTDIEYKEMQSDFQDSINDFAVNTIDSINDLLDTSNELKDTYDSLTNSTKYVDKQLTEYINQVDTLRGTKSLADYLDEQINLIDTSLNGVLTDENISLLLSQNVDDMQRQIDLIEEISDITGQTFENGAEDVLNYLDAINAVSEAMVTSNKNIKTWEDSFKTDEQLAQDLADTLGVSLAKSLDELDKLFNTLSTDTLGLTDAELEFLNANKDLLDTMTTSADIFDAWNSDISYLTLKQKEVLADSYYQDSLTNDSVSSVDAALKAAELAYKTSKTKEDYIPAFDTYINELSKQEPEKTVDDVVDRIDVLILRVEELEETQRRL